MENMLGDIRNDAELELLWRFRVTIDVVYTNKMHCQASLVFVL